MTHAGLFDDPAAATERSRAPLAERMRPRTFDEYVGQQDLLAAPEIGPITDAADIYEAVRRMRLLPISLRTLLGILLPMIVPLLGLYALQAPLRELGMYLLKMLA